MVHNEATKDENNGSCAFAHIVTGGWGGRKTVIKTERGKTERRERTRERGWRERERVEREREGGGRERQTDRETDRQTDRQTETERDRLTTILNLQA